MEDLETHYMMLLSREEQQFLKLYLQNPQMTNKTILHNKAFDLLRDKPYPVLDILLLQPPHVLVHIKWAIIKTFEDFLKLNCKTGFTSNFLIFLIKIPQDILSEALQGDLREQFYLCLQNTEINDKFFLFLLSRSDKQLLLDVLEYLKETQWKIFKKPLGTKEFVLYHALTGKDHFINPMIQALNDFGDIKDKTLRNNLIILKLVHELSLNDQRLEHLPKFEPLLQLMDLETVEEDLKPVYSFFYKDFKRLSVLIDYIGKFPDVHASITVGEVLNVTNILEFINKYKLLSSHDEVKALIESYYMWQQSTPMISIKERELEMLCYFYILSTVYDITMNTVAASEGIYTQKINVLNSLLRQIKNFETLCQVLEDICDLIFLRWEHLNNDQQHEKHKYLESSNTSYTDDDILPDSSTKSSHSKGNITKSSLKQVKTGFVCRTKSFASIFNFLKIFVTKKFHSVDYKQSTSEMKRRFQNIVDCIADHLWKYSFFDKMEKSQDHTGPNNPFINIDSESLMDFVHFHADSKAQMSSDDDIDDSHQKHLSWLSRRKSVKNRRRATFSGGAVASTSKMETNLQQSRARVSGLSSSVSSMEPIKRISESKNLVLPPEVKEERSIIPKLLSSPERMAFLALSLKKFNDAKQIIENFSLTDSQLNLELQYMEQQQQVKQKLLTIYENYQEQVKQSLNSNETTVERIRNVAARGFEVSKIISVIDNFAQMQRIKQSDAVKCLIQKHKVNPQYRFLTQFEDPNLNAVNICDLLISLPFNRDITNSILLVIKRHQAIQSSFNDAEHALEKPQFPPNIGPLHFLENLADCMRILGDKSINDLLCNNTYSLRPQKLSVEVAREKIFHEVFNKKPSELGRCEDLKSLIPQFQSLKSQYNYYQRFCSYMHHMANLVHLRDPNCEYHCGELLKIDPYDVIGELIFERNMTPLEIEANFTSLNLNFVHVIALNMCPEIVGKTTSKKYVLTPEKETTILNYISNHNPLLAHLLQGINNIDHFANNINDGDMNFMFLNQLLQMPEIEKLSVLYGGNKVITALKSDHVSVKSLEQLKSKMDQLEFLLSDFGIQEPMAVKAKRIDCLIIELIRDDPKNIYLASKIYDIAVRAKLIYDNFTKIATTRLAKELIEATLQHRHAIQKIPEELRQQLEVTLADITIYAQVSEVMQFETWPQAYDFGLKTPTTIFENLLQLHLYKLCYEWCKVVKLSENFVPQRKQFLNILAEALIGMGEEESANFELNSYEYLLQILETFDPVDCRNFLDSNKDKFRCMILLKYAIDYLERSSLTVEKNNYRNYKTSILILEQLTPGIRNIFWKLLKYPLLICEMLIMNTKFEILTHVLTAIRAELERVDGEASEQKKLCAFCFDKNGNVYDIHTKSSNSPYKARFQLGSHETANSSAFILLNFNLYQNDHFITNDCIDLLLRIYATKALDYQISDTNSSSEPGSQSTTDMQQSLDSLCGDFQMPEKAPIRSEWVRDEDATHCMCCRRAAFTMLMRRHHCRRCGRVVCFACSSNRMRIPELYEDVEVRICNDCQRLNDDYTQRKVARDSQLAEAEGVENIPVRSRRPKHEERFKWKLSGNITHDKLLREEFCYEHAPSVALCLSILEYHLEKQRCVDLLLYHCRKLEKLIVPNPEVDYELVAKMMNCLALAAKVRGGSAEFETIREHSEIIVSVVQNGCESLIPPDPFNNDGLRKLAASLVQAEKWDLALEVHLKFGFSTSGVMAAHALSCLRAGCYDTAREKLSYCMPKLTNETLNSSISKVIFNTVISASNDTVDGILGLAKDHDISVIKRPHNGPRMLQEILQLIESLPFTKPQPETLQRASIIRTSNTSLANLLTRKKEIYVKPMQDPALNILNTLANLKSITKGQYTSNSNESKASNNNELPVRRKQLFRKTRGFEECLYYTLTYGSHADVIQFLMNHDDLMATLKYFLLQKLDADIFINYIYLELLRKGQISKLIKLLQDFDKRLLIWRATLLQTCRYLETQNLLNSLYQLQVLLNDPIRASMTCVKFYTMNCENFQQQHGNAQHLHNARLHLQTELENAEWENINFNVAGAKTNKNTSRRSSTTSNTASVGGGNFCLQMDSRSLNAHISTIVKQLEVAKFLAECEVENSVTFDVENSEACKVEKSKNVLITEKYLRQLRIEPSKSLPTLFDKNPEKIQICILILLCGKNIYEGFGLAYRIIQHYKLPTVKVFATTAKYLARNQRLAEVEKLLNSINSNGLAPASDIDEILSVAINSAVNNHEPETKITLDNLTKKITSIDLRISSHIFIGQLKSAYLLANKYERLSDIRKILRQAEVTNQVHIKKLCEKKLQMSLPK